MSQTDVTRPEAAPPAVAPPPVAPPEEPRPEHVTVIKPSTRWPHLDLRELWHYRELAGRFVWRDLKVRYKQTAIGVVWAILQPFMTMVVFTLVFGKFAKFPSENLPYAVFVYSGLLPWTYFASSLALSSVSVVGNVTLVTKVYFPRVLLPLAAVGVPLVDFALAFTVLVGIAVYYDVSFSGPVEFVPFFLLLALMTALGVGLWLSSINVRYRDVPYAIPFLVQTWMWLSPVAYSVAALPERWQWVLSLNPMTAVINGFRWSLFGVTPAPDAGQVALSTVAALAFFLSGLAFFRASEPRFADTI